jgi:hypothetical protein
MAFTHFMQKLYDRLIEDGGLYDKPPKKQIKKTRATGTW